MITLPKETDVLVVGAGPAGLALATALRRLGVNALVVDRQAAGANTSRAAVVHARTLEVLDGIEVASPLIARGIEVPTFRVRDRDSCLLDVNFSELGTRYPFTLMVPQNITEQVLLDRLQALGGGVARPVELKRMRDEGEHVQVVLKTEAGEHEMAARWIVGCDGAHSSVREQADIAFVGGGYDETFVLADVRMDWPLDRGEVNLFLSRDGLVVVAPLPQERFRIVATVETQPATVDVGLLEHLMDGRGPSASIQITELLWSSCFHLQHRVAETNYSGRVLLCGDAAHVHSPAGGQGMNTGIQDAVSLARPLTAALDGGGVSGLSDWAARRHAVAQDVVSLTDRMTRMATLRSTGSRGLRNVLLKAVGHIPGVTNRIARRLAELDYR